MAFGARTGGAPIILGVLLLCLAFGFSGSTEAIFNVFPPAALGHSVSDWRTARARIVRLQQRQRGAAHHTRDQSVGWSAPEKRLDVLGLERAGSHTSEAGVLQLTADQGQRPSPIGSLRPQQVAPGSTRVGAYRPKRATERRSRLASMRTHIQLPEQHKSTFNHINYRFTER